LLKNLILVTVMSDNVTRIINADLLNSSLDKMA